jgi:L-ascorbate metabolism protein UlaG (beta-lactamase superfamily)
MSRDQRAKFTFLGHATVRCDQPGGEVMLIDPWIAGNPACPESVQEFDRLDSMLITHGHHDHTGDAVEVAKRTRPKIIVANLEICHWLASKGVEGCSGMNVGGGQDVPGARVWMVHADHSSGITDGERTVDGGVASGFVVRFADGYTIYHAGDTSLFSDMQLIGELYRPDLAFLPIGDHFTMDPIQAARACRYLGVPTVVPIHYGTFPVLTGTPEQFIHALTDLGVNTEVVVLRPGESY